MSDSRTKKIQKSDFIPNHYIITSDKDFSHNDKTLKAFQARKEKKEIINKNLNVTWREELKKSKISTVDKLSVLKHLEDFLCRHNLSNLPVSINIKTLEFTVPSGKLEEYQKNTKTNFTWDWKEQFEKYKISESDQKKIIAMNDFYIK
jgi:hypothetical protein